MAMAFDTDLKEAINKAIEPWRDSPTKPPFTQAQLIAMALVLSGEPMTSKQMMRWQMDTFAFFNEIAYELLWTRGDRWRRESEAAASMLHEQEKELYSYELPVVNVTEERIEKGREEDRCRSIMGTNISSDAYRITVSAARTVLRDLISTAPDGAFRFFDLPPELRNRIYEMLFKLPPSGLGVDNDFYSRGSRVFLHAMTKDFSKPFSMTRLLARRGNGLIVRDLLRCQNLLLANRQVFREAVPCLFTLNTLYCDSVFQLHNLISNVAPSRRPHLRQLAFRYNLDQTRNTYLQAFEALLSLPGLQRLHIAIDDEMALMKERRASEHRNMVQFPVDDIGDFNVPGIHVLRQLRPRVEIIFDESSSQIAALFSAEAEAEKLTEGRVSDVQEDPVVEDCEAYQHEEVN